MMKIREVGFQCKTCRKYFREVSIASLVGYVKAIQCGCGSWKIEEEEDEVDGEM